MKQVIESIKTIVDRKRIIDLTCKMIKINTVNPPGNEHKLVQTLIEEFAEINIKEVEVLEKEKGRSNLIARIRGNRPGPTIAIVGHTDVVPTDGQVWTNDPFDPVIQDNKIIGRGAIDNKGPFAASIESVRAFMDLTNSNFAGEILVIAAADEECGSDLGIKFLFEELGIKCDYALIPDGGELSDLIYGEMGIIWIEFKSKGKAYHGSMPENGVNAISPLAYLHTLLSDYNWNALKGDKAFDSVVLNLGGFRGGSAANIVPDFAEMSAMWRYPTGVKLENILEVVDSAVAKVTKKYTNAQINHIVHKNSIPFLANKKGKLIDSLLESADDLKLTRPTLKTIRAETVAKYIAQNSGAEVAVNGPMDGSLGIMHTADEYVEIDALVNFSQYYTLTLYKILAADLKE